MRPQQPLHQAPPIASISFKEGHAVPASASNDDNNSACLSNCMSDMGFNSFGDDREIDFDQGDDSFGASHEEAQLEDAPNQQYVDALRAALTQFVQNLEQMEAMSTDEPHNEAIMNALCQIGEVYWKLRERDSARMYFMRATCMMDILVERQAAISCTANIEHARKMLAYSLEIKSTMLLGSYLGERDIMETMFRLASLDGQLGNFGSQRALQMKALTIQNRLLKQRLEAAMQLQSGPPAFITIASDPEDDPKPVHDGLDEDNDDDDDDDDVKRSTSRHEREGATKQRKDTYRPKRNRQQQQHRQQTPDRCRVAKPGSCSPSRKAKKELVPATPSPPAQVSPTRSGRRKINPVKMLSMRLSSRILKQQRSDDTRDSSDSAKDVNNKQDGSKTESEDTKQSRRLMERLRARRLCKTSVRGCKADRNLSCEKTIGTEQTAETTI